MRAPSAERRCLKAGCGEAWRGGAAWLRGLSRAPPLLGARLALIVAERPAQLQSNRREPGAGRQETGLYWGSNRGLLGHRSLGLCLLQNERAASPGPLCGVSEPTGVTLTLGQLKAPGDVDAQSSSQSQGKGLPRSRQAPNWQFP